MANFLNRILLKIQFHVFQKFGLYRNGFEYKEKVFSCPFLIQHTEPENYMQIKDVWHPQNWQSQHATKTIQQYTLKNVYVTHDGVVIKKFSSFLPSIVYPDFYKRFNKHYVYHQLKQLQQLEEREIFLIWDHWSKQNYYHWIIDSLTRLVIAIENNTHVYLLLSDEMPQFVKDSLQAFSNVTITSFPSESIIKASKLHLISHPINSGFAIPKYIHSIKKTILASSILQSISLPRNSKIYVSRSRQKLRTVVNEQLIIDFLKLHDFTIIYFEDYTFWEQVYIMSNANVLVAPHGANMVNMMWMQAKSTIFEINIKETNNATLCYWSLASALEYTYNYIPCIMINNNFVVDENVIKQLQTYL